MSVCVSDDKLVIATYLYVCFPPGATVDSVLDGVNATPDLFPENLKDVPDINFFYRYGVKYKCVSVSFVVFES